ncbi:hypothetical protein V7O66_02750 [Methanolobus sp. ZRKC3]|uniref:hypothetical protein n=1 Tax=Methanolobus sp. ZRKC3 TaxID=3125786 RepID=UPI0032554012
MAYNSPNTINEEEIPLEPWANIGIESPDSEILQIYRLEQRIGTLSNETKEIRNLITRLEICHFKFERHIFRIIESIGRENVDFNLDSIGSSHPKCGKNAWRADKTGRSRKGQEYIWVLQMWLGVLPAEKDPRGIPISLFEEVYSSLGERDRYKEALVSALLNRLLWNFKTERKILPEELENLISQIDRTDICHYAFPENIKKTIKAIGELNSSPDFEGCGSYDERCRQIALHYFTDLNYWLQGGMSETGRMLGERTLLKKWLVVCLAKTIKELAGIRENMPDVSVSGDFTN